MAIKAISFLDDTKPGPPYRDAPSCYANNQWAPPLMAEATMRLFKPDVLLVFVSDEARRQNHAELERRVYQLYQTDKLSTQIFSVAIRSGKSEPEIWEFFTAIADAIQAGEQIIFDMTSGLRWLPILAFLAAAYVRIIRRADIHNMYFGSFGAADGSAPVFDLTPFVRLLDWITATDTFLKYGHAEDLSALIISLPEYQPLGGVLRSLTAALQTARSSETLEQAHRLAREIAQAQIAPSIGAHPLALLLDRISEEYSPLAHAQPTDPDRAREVVERQLEIIGWYIDKRMFVQALTAAREWMVSLTLMYARESLFDKARRKQAERLIRRERAPAFAAQVPNLDAIRAVWAQATAARNSVAHVGWSLAALSAQEIEDVARAVCAQLRGLID